MSIRSISYDAASRISVVKNIAQVKINKILERNIIKILQRNIVKYFLTPQF